MKKNFLLVFCALLLGSSPVQAQKQPCSEQGTVKTCTRTAGDFACRCKFDGNDEWEYVSYLNRDSDDAELECMSFSECQVINIANRNQSVNAATECANPGAQCTEECTRHDDIDVQTTKPPLKSIATWTVTCRDR